MGEVPKSLDSLRGEIDRVDQELVDLLNRRAQISISIGKSKKALSTSKDDKDHHHVYIPGREKKVFEKVSSLNHGPLTDEAVTAIYREIMSASISLQKEVVVSFLGPLGTYSHQAAANRFGESVAYRPEESISDVFTSVEKDIALYGVVPFENSTQGTVGQCIERLIDTTVKIRAETYLPIRHFLLSNSQKSSIKKIYSHPEAIGQCRKWLREHMPGVEVIGVSSTAYAAKIASGELNSAAISSESCAEVYDLVVLERDIQDSQINTTRFFVIGSECDLPTGDDKTLIMFTLDHRQPGALCDALGVFKEHKINLTKIDSRPIPSRKWHYYFFLELEGHYQNEGVAVALRELGKFCVDIKHLGSYPNFIKLHS